MIRRISENNCYSVRQLLFLLFLLLLLPLLLLLLLVRYAAMVSSCNHCTLVRASLANDVNRDVVFGELLALDCRVGCGAGPLMDVDVVVAS